jgi:hypothetical protein
MHIVCKEKKSALRAYFLGGIELKISPKWQDSAIEDVSMIVFCNQIRFCGLIVHAIEPSHCARESKHEELGPERNPLPTAVSAD